MTETSARRPRLSLPFTIVTDNKVVHLIAGEDVRYSLTLGSEEEAVAAVLGRCDGRRTLGELLDGIPEATRSATNELFTRLFGERILIDGTAADAHVAADYAPAAEGEGPLVERLLGGNGQAKPLAVLCQDTLDYQTALSFNRRCRTASSPYLWVTTGPLSRGYVSPVCWPDAGPCLECLLRHFQRLSPASHLYDALVAHGRRGGGFAPADMAPQATAMLEQIAWWKIKEASKPAPALAIFRLHVVEVESMEVSVHRVYVDPLCPECSHGRRV